MIYNSIFDWLMNVKNLKKKKKKISEILFKKMVSYNLQMKLI